MSLLLETIRLVDGVPQQLEWHQRRLAAAMRHHFPEEPIPSLAQVVAPPPHARAGTWKCRVVYGPHVTAVEYEPYTYRPFRRLAVVEAPRLDYRWKYADRQALAALKSGHPEADDVLIVQYGLLTDSTFANLVLEIDGVRYTPERPLLPGTMRAALLAAGRIRPAALTPAHLHRATRLWLVNAMRPLSDALALAPSEIEIIGT